MSFRSAFFPLILALATACAATRAPVRADFEPVSEFIPLPGACAAEPNDTPTGKDEMSRIGQLEQIAADLVQRDGLVPQKTLLEQLERRQCKLDLPGRRRLRRNPQEIYEECKNSILLVAGTSKCKNCGRYHPRVAAGFFLTKTGAFVTNYHVVNNPENISMLAMTFAGKVFPVKEVLAASKENDVAILRLDAGSGSFEPLPVSTEAPVGSAVCVISHPQRRFYSMTNGIVSQYFTMTTKAGHMPMMTITADYARGSSGAPILDEHGNAVGLVCSTSSVYYDVTGGKKGDLQMVFKQCIPAESVLKLIGR